MKNKFNPGHLIFLAAIFASFFLFDIGTVSAATSTPGCAQATAELIFRNEKGEFIPNLNVELYEQLTNVDGYPAPGKKVAGGKIDPFLGKATLKFTPKANVEGGYGLMIKAYDKSSSVGEFWYASELYLGCGETRQVSKTVSGIRFIFRDGSGALEKNFKFSLYTQRYDADGKPIKEKNDLISSALDTSEEGEVTVYVTDQSHVLRGSGGDYALVASPSGEGDYIEYYLHVENERTTQFEYTLSSALFTMLNAAGDSLPLTSSLEIYNQEKDAKGKPVLGESLKKISPDYTGKIKFEFQEGTYAACIKDSSGKNFIPFYNLTLTRGKLLEKKLVTPLLRLRAKNAAGLALPEKSAISIYDLSKDDKGRYFRNNKVIELKIAAKGYAETSLAPAHYLAVFKDGKVQYGQAFTVLAGKLQDITLAADSKKPFVATDPVIIAAVSSGGLANKLKGQILLQVEGAGEAWYVRPDNGQRVYLKDGDTAYELMRKLGLGITDADLKKIPIGFNQKIIEADLDTDADGLPNKLEEALGTDPFNYDSDGDGVSDGSELTAGSDPLSAGRLSSDTNFAARLKGRILLQTQSRGEAWYVYPKDGRRYYMKDGAAAYQLMRYLSLGITNDNLDQIEEGSIE
jgi:TfoX/Sxy family transcriptional regulator of competence genes